MIRQAPPGREPGKRAPAIPSDELSLNELYFTIQGECRFQGAPTVFVRVSHCPLRCTWCFGPGTRVLMGDWSWKGIEHVLVGEMVMGRARASNKLVRTTVTGKAFHDSETVLVNGSVVSTPDHKFLVHSRWRRIERLVGHRVNFVAGPRPLESQPEHDRGYLAGIADGDGCFWDLKTGGKRPYRRFRLAMNDRPVLDAFQRIAASAGFRLYNGRHGKAGNINGHVYAYKHMEALWLTTDSEAIRFQTWLNEDVHTDAWHRGYLAGIFDAEGSLSHTDGQGNHLRIAQHEDVNPDVCRRIENSLAGLGFGYTKEKAGYLVHSKRGGHYRFISWCRPARTKSTDVALGTKIVNTVWIDSVVPTGRKERVVDLTTTEGSFVAEGFVVHNCDSKYTFNEGTPRKIAGIVAEVGQHPTKHVCITGGEPLAQVGSFSLIQQLAEGGYTVEVETSGAEDIAPLNRLGPDLRKKIVVNLDVKCPGSAMTNFNRWQNLGELRPHDQLKFVLLDEADYAYAKGVLAEHAVPCEVFLHPVWGKLDAARIADWVKRDGLPVRVGIQLHKVLWGDVRGV